MSFIGYARVSTSEEKQLLDRQVDALTEIGCERIFEDKASGSNSQRKGLDDCLNYLRKGDVLVVLDLDRLGRLASDLIKLIDELAENCIGFKAINSPMDTTTPAGRAFLQIQGKHPTIPSTTILKNTR
ncbi:recombinase family protein [Moraxella sp. 179-F 1C4 NHS]